MIKLIMYFNQIYQPAKKELHDQQNRVENLKKQISECLPSRQRLREQQVWYI